MDAIKVVFVILIIFGFFMVLHQGFPKTQDQAIASVSTEAKGVLNILGGFLKNLWEGDKAQPKAQPNQNIPITNITGGINETTTS